MSGLLEADDPPAFKIENARGQSPILFVSDHAGVSIPRRLGSLGLDPHELSLHIASDIGIYGVTSELARNLDSTYLYQPYSRLVIDCNRNPDNAQSVVTISDGVMVPGNADLAAEDIALRRLAILEPYQMAIGDVIARRRKAGQPTVLICMHSCTPLLAIAPTPRPWHNGILANRDRRVADPLIELLRRNGDLCVGSNQPYTVDADSDYTIPLHAEPNDLPYVEIEIRQDLISDGKGQMEWARLLEDVFPRAVELAGVLANA